MNNKPLTQRQQYWFDHIKACQQQDGSTKDYAQQQGIELRALYDAKNRLVKAGVLPGKKRSDFQRVKVKPVPVLCTITLPNGVRLEWPTDNSPNSLNALITAFGQYP